MKTDGAASRDRALDGLRGIAALIVLTSHLFVAGDAVFADALLEPGSEDGSALQWALTYTPLHFLWGGNEAVIVFFVLSGYVLALPGARGESFRASSYYPRRMLRLYLPVWGALCMAAVAHLLVQSSTSGQTWWLEAHTAELTQRDVWHSVLLLDGAGTFALLGVLWSLHWEVLFSLLLPLFLLLGRVTARFYVAAAALAFAVLLLSDGREWALYMPCFALGTVMAFQRDRIDAPRAEGARARLDGRLGAGPDRVLVAAHRRPGSGHGLPARSSPGRPGRLWPGDPCRRRAACAAPAQRSPGGVDGGRSFSLYLVQEPIVVLAAFALGTASTLPLLIIVAAPIVLLLTEGFYRVVERPSHQLARSVRLSHEGGGAHLRTNA